MTLKDIISNTMDQDKLLSIIGMNSLTGLASAIILILGYLKGMELLNFGSIPTALTALFIILFLSIYYKYFLTNMEFTKNNKFGWKEFFYNDIVDKWDNCLALIVSAMGAAGCEFIIIISYSILNWVYNNINSPVVYTGIKIGIIGLIASMVFMYMYRNHFTKEEFWNTVKTCIVYGFGLSISFYLLGHVIGISIMVFGLPITVAIVLLQITFTSVYTYIDLVEWSKKTRKIPALAEFTNEEALEIVTDKIN